MACKCICSHHDSNGQRCTVCRKTCDGDSCTYKGILQLNPFKVQHGGSHYTGLVIQPTEYALKNKLGFAEGNIVKYATRHALKGGAEDVKKMIHYGLMLLKERYGEDYDFNQDGGKPSS